MELDLSPKLAKKVYGDNGGSYHAWCPNELPMLREGNIGAAKLALEKNGFALPRYSDSSKVAYVLQGNIFSNLSDCLLFPFNVVGFLSDFMVAFFWDWGFLFYLVICIF